MLIKRFSYYLVGFSFGIVFLVFFYKQKNAEFCYLPNCRTLKSIRTQEKIIYKTTLFKSPKDSIVKQAQIDSILTYGTINFSKSKIVRNLDPLKKACNTYFVEGTINNDHVGLTVENCKHKATVLSLEKL